MSPAVPALGTVLPLPLLLTLAGVLGLAVGSFLNVVVHRVPAGLSVVHPGSACPACRAPVRGLDNVPVVSWLLLRGRCRGCAVPISPRYPAVEAGTAALFVLLAATESEPALLVATLVLGAAGVALALIDLEHGRLPFGITATTGVLAGSALLAGWGHLVLTRGLADGGAAALPAVLGATGWLVLYGGIWLATSGRGMGLGDVALAPVLGLVLGAAGPAQAAVGLAAGFVLGAVVGGILIASGRVRRGQSVPFGPFMLVGAGVGLLAGPGLAGLYLRLVGLG